MVYDSFGLTAERFASLVCALFMGSSRRRSKPHNSCCPGARSNATWMPTGEGGWVAGIAPTEKLVRAHSATSMRVARLAGWGSRPPASPLSSGAEQLLASARVSSARRERLERFRPRSSCWRLCCSPVDPRSPSSGCGGPPIRPSPCSIRDPRPSWREALSKSSPPRRRVSEPAACSAAWGLLPRAWTGGGFPRAGDERKARRLIVGKHLLAWGGGRGGNQRQMRTSETVPLKQPHTISQH